MLQLKLSAAKLNKQTNNSICFGSNLKKITRQGNTKIWYHLRMEKTEEIHIEFQYIILRQVYKY